MIKNRMKHCPNCKIWKPTFEFYKDKVNKDGLRGYCKSCTSKKAADWYQVHKKESLAQSINWQKQHPLNYKLSHIKAGVKTRGYKWKLSDEYVMNLIQQPCVYCGSIDKNYNGLDRIDSSKGYIKDNVVSCCKRCNYMKSNLIIKKFLEHIEKIHKYNKKMTKNEL